MNTVFDLVSLQVADTLIRKWTCRHCAYDNNPTLSEFCDSCGIEDCHQGKGEESEPDKKLRLSGKRGPTGIWTEDRVAGLVRGLVK